MAITEVRDDDYCIQYESSSATAIFEGKLSLRGPAEYAPIADLLESVVLSEPEHLTLNLQKLQFLNSSGIRVLSKFIFNLKKKTEIRVTVLGTKDIAWQSKSLKNLKKFMPELTLTIE
ncbi:slr1659 superfamily regulator [Roseofilum casamattae]|uniref:STAS domain-containing protein n=1 Tax=Roseofilum casamattae BLCC-M143 TaxID=3022442 RepID=A0ABT7BUC1_9CYAN|nr:STAS domain-containing protein [Roseofilum casamattae]MDJ1182784.1 hypothetical protein [Roseofilum casamattae BLCC-M143]